MRHLREGIAVATTIGLLMGASADGASVQEQSDVRSAVVPAAQTLSNLIVKEVVNDPDSEGPSVVSTTPLEIEFDAESVVNHQGVIASVIVGTKGYTLNQLSNFSRSDFTKLANQVQEVDVVIGKCPGTEYADCPTETTIYLYSPEKSDSHIWEVRAGNDDAIITDTMTSTVQMSQPNALQYAQNTSDMAIAAIRHNFPYSS